MPNFILASRDRFVVYAVYSPRGLSPASDQFRAAEDGLR